jgi:copper transport protein
MRAPLSLLLALLALLAGTAEARAHARLSTSSPPDGAILAAPPERLELAFVEPVAPLLLALETAEGAPIAVRVEPMGDGSRFVLVPTERLTEGSYLVRWRVVSADGHPVAGRVAFAVGPRVAMSAAEAPRDHAVSSALRIAVRALHLATIVLGGGIVATLLLLPLGPAAAERSRRLARTLLVASLPTAIARFAVTGLDASGLPLSALLGAEPWRAALASGIVPALATSAAGAFLLLAATGRSTRPALLSTVLGLLLAAGGFGLTGHTATAPPAALFAPALVLHLLLAMVWLGGLLPLAFSLRHDPPMIARAVLERFSDRMLAVVPVLLAIGMVLAMRQVPDGAALLESAWGRILLLKLAFLLGLLAIAAVNRFRLVPRLVAGDEVAGPQLRRLLALDLGLALLLITATAGLGSTAPPRLPAAPPGRESPGREIRLTDGSLAARLDVVPAIAGWNRLAVRFEPAEPVPLEVRLRLAPAEEAAEPIEAVARLGADGVHRTDPLLLVPAGTWRLAIGVLLDPFSRVELEGRLDLVPAGRSFPTSNRSGEPR